MIPVLVKIIDLSGLEFCNGLLVTLVLRFTPEKVKAV